MTISLQQLGFDSYRVKTVDGSEVYQIDTPFKLLDEEKFYIFSEQIGNSFRFFDEGMTLHSLMVLGVDFLQNGRMSALGNFLRSRKVSLLGDGEIEYVSSLKESASDSFVIFLKSLLDVEIWTRKALSISGNSKENLINEAKMCFKRLHPKEEITAGRKSVQGIDGKQYSFDFGIGESKVVDTLLPSREEGSSFSYKTLAINPSGLISIGVIDDRFNPRQAKDIQKVIGLTSEVVLLSDLNLRAMNSPNYVLRSGED